MVRSPENRLKNWNGTVHYAAEGRPACGPISTAKSWLTPSVATVTCGRCIAMFGADTPGQVDPEPTPNEHVARRAEERAARRAARPSPPSVGSDPREGYALDDPKRLAFEGGW